MGLLRSWLPTVIAACVVCTINAALASDSGAPGGFDDESYNEDLPIIVLSGPAQSMDDPDHPDEVIHFDESGQSYDPEDVVFQDEAQNAEEAAEAEGRGRGSGSPF